MFCCWIKGQVLNHGSERHRTRSAKPWIESLRHRSCQGSFTQRIIIKNSWPIWERRVQYRTARCERSRLDFVTWDAFNRQLLPSWNRRSIGSSETDAILIKNIRGKKKGGTGSAFKTWFDSSLIRVVMKLESLDALVTICHLTIRSAAASFASHVINYSPKL
jgi:hypothetical protein